MPPFRVTVGLVALAVASLVGDQICRRFATGGDQGRLLRLGAEAVSRLPTTIGPWRMISSEPLDNPTLQMLQCRGHVSRVYIDDETGEQVSLILLVGAAGPLVVHTPEICYSSVNFEIAELAHSEVVRGAGSDVDTLAKVVFRSRSVAAERQSVFYGWRRPGGHWESPTNPRLMLGGAPMLFKLQLGTADGVQSLPSGDDATTSGADQRFLADLLPILAPLLDIR